MFEIGNLKAVLFDFGETLFEPLSDMHERRNLLEVKWSVGVGISDDEFVEGYKQAKNGTVTEFASRRFFLHQEMIGTALGTYLESLGSSAKEAVVASYCEAQRRAVVNSIRPREDCVLTITRLRQLGLELAIVSNIDNSWMDPIIERFNLLDWFNLVLTSETAVSCKPDPRIFELAMGKMQRTPDECVFVGDSEVNDISGALRAGMGTIRYCENRGKFDSEADTVVDRLSQIPDLFVDPDHQERQIPTT